jgi:hypothetical protein
VPSVVQVVIRDAHTSRVADGATQKCGWLHPPDAPDQAGCTIGHVATSNASRSSGGAEIGKDDGMDT